MPDNTPVVKQDLLDLEGRLGVRFDTFAQSLIQAFEIADARTAERMEQTETKLLTEMHRVEARLDAKIDGAVARLDAKIDGVEVRLTERIESSAVKRIEIVERRLADLEQRLNRPSA